MKLTDGDYALKYIGNARRIRLMKHALIAVANGSRFICVYSGDYDELVRYLVRYFFKSRDILENGCFAVGGARSYYKNELVAFAGENGFYFVISFFFFEPFFVVLCS